MSSSKRRRLDTSAEQPQALSAIARLRQRAQQSTKQQAVDPLSSTAVEDKPPAINASDGPKKTTRSAKSKSPAKLEQNPSVQDPLSTGGVDKDSSSRPPIQDATAPSRGGRSESSPSPDQETPPSVQAPEPVIQLSTFAPTKGNFKQKAGGKIQLHLSGGERLVILGSYGIRVNRGEITIHGALLRPADKTYWVHAPHCHALPVIRCSDQVSLDLEPHPAAESIRKLGRLSPLFRRLWNDEPDSNQEKSKTRRPTFQILFTSADGPKKAIINDLKSPPEWNREIVGMVAASRSKPITAMVSGPKSSGKSTFGKILANQLLTDTQKSHSGVAVLDLDPGQPEYAIAGQIALVHITEPVLEPSFCRPLSKSGIRILRTHTLASTSPASDPELYCAAAIDLFTHYRNRLGSCSLVINTPGWIQGTGLDLLTTLIRQLRPVKLVFMSRTGPADVVDTLQEACGTSSLVQLPSQSTVSTSRTAAELRNMQNLAYFHAEPSKLDARFRWNPDPLTAIPPWLVRYSGPQVGVQGIVCYDYQVPPALLSTAINGTILAVVKIESKMAFMGLSTDEQVSEMDVDDQMNSAPNAAGLSITTPEGIPFLRNGRLDPRYSHALGLVLVRGIDVENGLLQLLTPIPPEVIDDVNSKQGSIVLVSGKFDPATWAYTEDLYLNERSAEVTEGDADEPMADGEVAEDVLDDGDEKAGGLADSASVPWVEVVHGNQNRAGSKVWRVRRDLGRGG